MANSIILHINFSIIEFVNGAQRQQLLWGDARLLGSLSSMEIELRRGGNGTVLIESAQITALKRTRNEVDDNLVLRFLFLFSAEVR